MTVSQNTNNLVVVDMESKSVLSNSILGSRSPGYSQDTTMVSDNMEYFGSEEYDLLTSQKLKNPYFFHQHVVNFSYGQYFEFLFHHLLSFVILGPLINIYSLIFRKNKWLMYNMQFAPRMSVSFFW